MTEFTPLQALTGGAIIGTAAVLLMAVHGLLGGLIAPRVVRTRTSQAGVSAPLSRTTN